MVLDRRRGEGAFELDEVEMTQAARLGELCKLETLSGLLGPADGCRKSSPQQPGTHMRRPSSTPFPPITVSGVPGATCVT